MQCSGGCVQNHSCFMDVHTRKPHHRNSASRTRVSSTAHRESSPDMSQSLLMQCPFCFHTQPSGLPSCNNCLLDLNTGYTPASKTLLPSTTSDEQMPTIPKKIAKASVKSPGRFFKPAKARVRVRQNSDGVVAAHVAVATGDAVAPVVALSVAPVVLSQEFVRPGVRTRQRQPDKYDRHSQYLCSGS